MTEATDELGDLFRRPEDAGSDKRVKELKAAVEAVFDTLHMRQKGVINSLQVFQLTRAVIYARQYNSDVMSALVETLLEFSVSNKGRGRTDLKTLLQAIMHSDETEEDSLRKRLLGA